MLPDFARFSFNQLQVLQVLLNSPQTPVSVAQIAKKTNLKGKALGAVLSSLVRINSPLIQPAGKAISGGGLRWLIDRQIDLSKARQSVNQTLTTYV